VEVINKKLWQEVIKGLGLPSSITSAAFTLRTQYTKYLYPYECTKKNLSNPNDLAAAIEGNKREGRRGSYGAYHDMGMGMQVSSQAGGMMPSQISPMSLVTGPPRFNGNGNSHAMPPSSHSPANGGPHDPMSAIEMTRLALLKMYGASPPVSLPNLPPLPGLPADILQQAQQQQEKAMNLHLQQQKSAEDFASRVRESERLKTSDADDEEEAVETAEDEEPEPVVKKSSENHTSILENENSLSPIPSKKRHRSNDSDDEVEVSSPKKQQTLGLPGVNIKMANRGDGRNGDSSLVVSLEINGTTYQGVLFAQPGSGKQGQQLNRSSS